MTNKITNININHKSYIAIKQIISRYLGGESIKSLSIEYGIARGTMTRWLIQNDIALRGRTQANELSSQKRTPEQNKLWSQAAHDAVRGSKKSNRDLELRAKTIEQFGKFGSPYEKTVHNWLVKRGYKFTVSKAFGVYNCDLATDTIAVEIWGGNWHFYGRHAARTAERFDYLFNRGVSVIVVNVTKRNPLKIAVADKLIALIKFASDNPTPSGQYWMIGGDGDDIILTETYAANLALIPARVSAQDLGGLD